MGKKKGKKENKDATAEVSDRAIKGVQKWTTQTLIYQKCELRVLLS